MGALEILNGSLKGHRYEVSVPDCVVGRHPECQIVVDENSVSRQHARIIKNGAKYFVEDLGSRNKTYLNGEELVPSQRRELRNGDLIKVCDTEFAFAGDVGGGTGPLPIFNTEHSSASNAVMVDDRSSGSTIQGTFEVSSHYKGKGVTFSATPESRLGALLEITQSLGKALSLDAVLNQILSTLFKIFMQADRGFVVLADAEGNLVPRWVKTRRESDEVIRISRTIIKSVMETKSGLLSQDASSDQRFEMSESLANFKIRSLMCAPLVDSEGNVIGALQIDTLDQRQRFEQQDLEVLVGVAIQAGVAIHNMQLQERAIEQRQMQRDLQVAQEVQESFLPQKPPALPGYKFYAFYKAANKIGGDYYDYIELPDGRVAVIVADVVGHGVAAALLMAKLAAESRFCLAVNRDPAVAITDLNKRFNTMELGHFVTLILVVLDPDSGEAVLVNAGHMAPIVRRVSGEIYEPGEDEGGLPIGVMDGWHYESATFELLPGERAVLFTDGLNETMVEDEEFGIDRIREMVGGAKSSIEDLGAAIMSKVESFSKEPQQDDRCLVIIERTSA